MRLGQISFVSFLSRILASVVGFIATVVITQTLGSGIFGTYALVVAVVIWLKTIAIMGVRSAMVKRLSESGDTGEYVVAAALLLTVILTGLSLILLAVAGYVNQYVGQSVTLVVILLTWASAAVAFASGVLQGRRLVHYASALKPLNTGVRSAVQIVVVFAGGGLFGILFGFGLGAIVAAAVGFLLIGAIIGRPGWRHFRELLTYARFAWLGRLSSRSFTSIDTVVLGVFVPVSLIGIYEVAWNLASILAVFGTAIAQTLFPEFSHVSSRDETPEIAHLLDRGLAYAGLLLVPGLIGSLVVGDLVLLVYGSEFSQGAFVLVLLVLSRVLYVYADQLLTVLNGMDRPDLAFRINLAFILSNLALNVLLVWRFGWYGAAIATVISAGLALTLAFCSTRTLVTGFTVPTGELLKQFVAAMVMGILVGLLRLALPETLAVGVILVGIGAGVYFLVLFGISVRFRQTVSDNLPHG